MQLQEKRVITKDDIFSKINDLDIYKTYCPDFSLVQKIHSPFRKDTNPSLGFFKGSREIMFKDLATGEKGDPIDFVMKMFSLSYFEALSKIATDFGFDEANSDFFFKDHSNIRTESHIFSNDEYKAMIDSMVKPELAVTVREWNNVDAEFWAKRGVNFRTLQFYRVVPISQFFINDKIIKADKLAYAFIETKDGEETYKIYQPLNKEGLKWFSSHNSSIWQGWTQLPELGTELIITKSLKDVMTIGNIMKIPAVALQSENTLPKESVIKELETRFDIIYVLYDNDFDKEINIGREMGGKIARCFTKNIFQIEIPTELKSKDSSDLVYNMVEKTKSITEGYKEAHSIINNLLCPF